MNVPPYQKQKSKRLIWLFLSMLVFLICGGSALWFFAAGKLEDSIAAMHDRIGKKQQSFTCDNQTVHGFPFRLGVFCDAASFADSRQQFNIEVGALRSAAQIYAPGKVVAELDGPARLTIRSNEFFDFNWQSLRSSIRANLDGVQRLSIASQGLNVSGNGDKAVPVNAETAQLHARKSGKNDVEIAFGVKDLVVTPKNSPALEPVSITLETTGFDIFDVLQRGVDIPNYLRKNGIKIDLAELKLLLNGGAKIGIAGPLHISSRGLMSGSLEITTENLPQLIEFLKGVWPNLKDPLDQAGLAISALLGGNQPGEKKLVVNLKNNAVSVGIIPLGVLRPLF